MSLWFYGYSSVWYLGIMIFSILVNYLIYILFQRKIKVGVYRRWLLLVAILFNVGVLFFFKYYDFFIENMNAAFHFDWVTKNLVLPLGISFFTFQQLSFVVDAYKGKLGQYRFLEYALFVCFFPQLIAGPIVTHDELIPQFLDEEKRKFDYTNFSMGIFIFTLGLTKKILLADVFGKVVGWGFSYIDVLDSTNAIIVMLSYTFQIYFDFSGYCDMAVGIGKMMNIDLPLNFNSPYKALTIADFWKRWHMTLTRFLTVYIYIPLGGGEKVKASDIYQYNACFYHKRYLAWGKLDVCFMGNNARHFYGSI